MTVTPAPFPTARSVMCSAVRRHRFIIIAMPVICVIIAVLAIRIIPQRYEAFGLIEVAAHTPDINLLTTNTVTLPNDSMVLTQVEIIKSHAVIQRAAAVLHMPYDAVEHTLTISPIGRSFIIRVLASNQNAETAQTIANTVMLSYHKHKAELKTARLTHNTNWLNDHLTKVAKKMHDSAQAVIDYRVAHKLPDDTVLARQISELGTQLVAAQAEQAALQAQQDPTRSTKHPVLNAQLKSPSLITLTQDETLARQKLADLLQRYGDKHPDLQAAKAELAVIQSKQQQELVKLNNALKQDHASAGQTVQNLQAQIDQLQERHEQDNAISIQLHTLEEDANTNRLLYDNLLQRSKESSLFIDLEQTDAQPVAWAAKPTRTVNPNPVLVILLSGLAGLLLAVIAIVLSEQLSTPSMKE